MKNNQDHQGIGDETTIWQIQPPKAGARGSFSVCFSLKNVALHLSRLCYLPKIMLFYVILSHLADFEPTMKDNAKSWYH